MATTERQLKIRHRFSLEICIRPATVIECSCEVSAWELWAFRWPDCQSAGESQHHGNASTFTINKISASTLAIDDERESLWLHARTMSWVCQRCKWRKHFCLRLLCSKLFLLSKVLFLERLSAYLINFGLKKLLIEIHCAIQIQFCSLPRLIRDWSEYLFCSPQSKIYVRSMFPSLFPSTLAFAFGFEVSSWKINSHIGKQRNDSRPQRTFKLMFLKALSDSELFAEVLVISLLRELELIPQPFPFLFNQKLIFSLSHFDVLRFVFLFHRFRRNDSLSPWNAFHLLISSRGGKEWTRSSLRFIRLGEREWFSYDRQQDE